MTTEYSPSGLLVCQSEGSRDAAVVFIGESPAGEEMREKPFPRPFVGRAGRVLDMGLRHAGFQRSDGYFMNLVPARAPKDKFAMHSPEDVEWGRQRFAAELATLRNAKVYIPLGANPLRWLLGDLPTSRHHDDTEKEGKSSGPISMWRGSVLPVHELRATVQSGFYEDYLRLLKVDVHPSLNDDAFVVPTFHPAAISRQFSWHPWLLNDLRIAKRLLTEGRPALPKREWFFNNPAEFARLAFDKTPRGTHVADLISVDTEQEPVWIVGIATDTEVHVFEYTDEYRPALIELLTAPDVVKVAHNWAHDFAFFRLSLKIDVAWPIVDVMGNANIIDSSLRKALSPHVTTRWGPGWKWETNRGSSIGWPYHKWLDNVDPLLYNGIDIAATYDAYWPQVEEMSKRKLLGVAQHDHDLFQPLLDMQRFGFRVNEAARLDVQHELDAELTEEKMKLADMVKPVVEAKLHRFQKPHLFRVKRKCPCCGGGTTQRSHCYACFFAEHGAPPAETKETAATYGFKSIKAMREAYPACSMCNGTGKIDKDLEFNPDSADQLSDVLYRGLGIAPRRYKGAETIRVGQLEPLAARYPLVAQAVTVSRKNADFETVSRLEAGADSRLHCVLDPFGTVSGRVAGKAGLLEAGTNPMNIPKKARRFVVPDPGFTLLYPDMAQIELRAVASLASTYGDRSLLELVLLADSPSEWFAKGYPSKDDDGITPDMHRLVRDDVRKLAPWAAEFSRDQTKRLVYGGMWGGGAPQLAKELSDEALRKGEGTIDLTAEKMEAIIKMLFATRFRAVNTWRNAVRDEVLRTRQLRSPTGRLFHFHGYTYDKKTKDVNYEVLKQAWSRQPQDIAAWVLGLGLIALYDSEHWGTLLRPMIHVHDATLMQAPTSQLAEAKRVGISFLTRDAFGMHFPADMKTGANWYECS